MHIDQPLALLPSPKFFKLHHEIPNVGKIITEVALNEEQSESLQVSG